MTAPSDPVAADDVSAARELLRGVVRTTPLLRSRPLREKVAGDVYVKCENLQRAGSFKTRGAYTRIARLAQDERARGVVAASAGNHAQGVALAAGLLGAKSTIFMPEGAPLPKVEATTSYGAEAALQGSSVAEVLAAASAHAERTGAEFIHPFDHRDIVAGQGTVGLEILEQCPDVRTILVPVGGGGLLAGVALAVKPHRPDVRVIGVQAEGAAAYPPSLATGHPVALSAVSTMADGIAVSRPGDTPFGVISETADGVLAVSEESLSRALLLCLERAKLIVEPAGAAGVAALLDQPHAFKPPVVAILSGGNIDPLLLVRVLRHGLAAAGRYLSLRCRIPDRPGALAQVLGELAEQEANVLDVVHERTAARLHVNEVEVFLQLETRGPKHCEAVLDSLREAGYPLVFG